MEKTEKTEDRATEKVKSVWKLYCTECYSRDVQVIEWIRPNTNEVVEPSGDDYVDDYEAGAKAGHTWCEKCMAHTVLDSGWDSNA